MKARVLSVVLASCLLAGAGALLAAPAPEAPVENALGENLLFNPSFEGAYIKYDPSPEIPDCPSGICDTAKTAAGWTPYWRSHNPADPDYIFIMPEFDAETTVFTDPVRVRSGDLAQSYYWIYSTFEAGVYQQVGVTLGNTYCFSAWGHTWSAQDDPGPHGDAYSGPEYGNFRQRVGIDPTGGTDWQSSNIVWGSLRIQPDFYAPFVVTATAQADAVTVYVYGQPEWAVKHNDAYWDDAYLGQVEPVLPEGDLTLTVTPDSLLMTTMIVNPNWLCDPDTNWAVNVQPDGAFVPSVSTMSGATGDELAVTFGAAGLERGVYRATLQFISPETAETLPVIPVQVDVQVDLTHLYLPSVTSGQ